jgi:hypothetical protein
MFFKKKPEHDIAEIKEAMEKPIEEIPTAPRMKPVPAPVQRVYREPIEVAPKTESGAPLFVKVEKYREILTTLQEMKLFVSGVKQLFAILHELETVRGDAINVMRATVQRLEKSMMEVDSELLRPRGVSLGDISPSEGHIDNTLEDLQNQLAELRKELQSMR